MRDLLQPLRWLSSSAAPWSLPAGQGLLVRVSHYRNYIRQGTGQYTLLWSWHVDMDLFKGFDVMNTECRLFFRVNPNFMEDPCQVDALVRR